MTVPPYRQSLDHCPIAPEDASLRAACRDVAARLAADDLRALTIARREDDLPALEVHAAGIAARADDVLLLGMGGSSLGARALLALAAPGHAGPRIHILDNVDPDTWARLSAWLDPRRTHMLAISKSGGTLETMALVYTVLGWMAEHSGGFNLGSAITEPTPRGSRAAASPLRGGFEAVGQPIFDHDPGIGGRYAVLSNVGVLPALLGGLDPRALRRGAVAVLDDFRDRGPSSAPARGAALAVALQRDHGRGVHVMMPYADRLAWFARWYVQLWAESLGKGGQGSTPVAALGAVDQHSQLQLWIDGPPVTWVTVIGLDQAGQGPVLASGSDMAQLAGRTLGDVMNAEREATVESLAAAGVPVRTMMLDRLDETALGALFAHFMLETVIAGHMLGVDPFGQPAVEDGKRRAIAKLEAMT